MFTCTIGKSAGEVESFFGNRPGAAYLGPRARKDISIRALARAAPVSRLAQQNGVSRKFVYQQVTKASEALDHAFTPAAEDRKVLFHLPVTKEWIRQFTLAQVLIGHTSAAGVREILDAVFDYRDISDGWIYNTVQDAVVRSRTVNAAEDLSSIRVGAHDEIFQSRRPVLVGCCVNSTYCYLLVAEDHRDGTTWGVHLLDLSERGLDLDHTIADEGKGLRAGQLAAWGTRVPCHGDVFHAERQLSALALYLENRAQGCTLARQKLEQKMNRAKSRKKGASFSKRLAQTRTADAKAIQLAEDVAALAHWMQNDILSLAGPNLDTRRNLFDFVVAELLHREPLCPHRIQPVRCMLETHRDNLLAFAALLDDAFTDIALASHVPLFLVQAVCQLHGMDQNAPAYWQCEGELRRKLTGKFHEIDAAVQNAMAETCRASSVIENLNSRLRNYFFLRRIIGNDYLDLLRFFLNHRPFMRSRRGERVGKSPAVLLTGKSHPHWLELLGHHRFLRN
jgi:hypothetical protein